MHKRGILWIVKHDDGQIRNWYIFGSHLRCHVEFLEKPKGDKVAVSLRRGPRLSKQSKHFVYTANPGSPNLCLLSAY